MKLILLDAGHGWISDNKYDPGAVNGEYKEAEIANQYVNSIRFYLKQYKNEENKTIYKILQTEKQTVLERRRYAEQINPDCFVSVHLNASYDKNKKGYEVWYRYNYDFSKSIYTKMHEVMKNYSLGRGIRRDLDYGRRLGILATKISIPTCLIEVGFISNDSELQWLLKRETRILISKAIAEGIHDYLKSKI
ncbi:MAG: N-acetylmuramoyl-L-alanine amidase [Candidatus Calescibacterium sp.]|nr:N-acetylmuramoyl-L-alanine amidase [Candidatus Calescibacterium sp.]